MRRVPTAAKTNAASTINRLPGLPGLPPLPGREAVEARVPCIEAEARPCDGSPMAILGAMTLIPPENAEVIARRFGESGAAFLRELPERVRCVCERWALEPLGSLPVGIGGYLLAVRMNDSREAVLKLSPTGGPQDAANAREAHALRRWHGSGAVQLFNADPQSGALLIERCVPGDTIDNLPDADMIRSGCLVARRLQVSPDAIDLSLLPDAVADAQERARRLPSLMKRLGNPLSAEAEHAIDAAHRTVADGSAPRTVCHGDLNPGNLLAAGRERWLAVDPLPVLAEPSYDAASLIWSRRSWLLEQGAPRDVLRERIRLAADTLGVAPARIRAWALVRLTQILEDRFTWGGYNETPFIQVGELVADEAA
jgi:streptomycin 6-kinase